MEERQVDHFSQKRTVSANQKLGFLGQSIENPQSSFLPSIHAAVSTHNHYLNQPSLWGAAKEFP